MIKYLNILIGSACDMKCPYCLQTNEKSEADRKSDPVQFANRLVEYLKGSNIRKIAYWGGEPMLYWERIKTIHRVLTEQKLIPTEKSIITTNGRKLTEDYVEYVNNNPDIFTVVSWHDGKFSDEQLKLIFQLNHFSISQIIHHFHTDMWDTRDLYWELYEKFGRFPHMAVHFLRANDGCGSEYYLTKEDVDRFCEHLNEVVQLAAIGDQWALWQCAQLLYHRNRLKPYEGPMCVRDELLSVDIHGNTYACHHNYDKSNITGNIFKKVIPIHPRQPLSPRRFFDTEECQNCKAFEECRGGCYTSNTHEIDCYFAKKRYPIYKLMENLFK